MASSTGDGKNPRPTGHVRVPGSAVLDWRSDDRGKTMFTMLVLATLVVFAVYMAGSLAAKYTDTMAGVGKALFGLFRK